MAKHPWMKFYPGAWLSDRRVALMTPAEKGVYIDLLCLCWQEGSIPADADQLAFILRLSRRAFAPLWITVRGHFDECSPGLLTNKRIESERAEAISRSENGRKAANKLWQDDAPALPGHSGGNAIKKEKESKKEKNKEIVADADAPPLPFKVDDAVGALATASCGRFTASKLSKGQAINAVRLIKEAPALGTWTLVGEWLAAGGDGWKGNLDVRHLGDFSTWTAHATRWAANGRGPVNAKNGSAPRMGNTAPSANFAEAGDKTAEYT